VTLNANSKLDQLSAVKGRLVRSVAGLLGVLAAYFAYDLLAVPLIEPHQSQPNVTRTDQQPSRPTVTTRYRQLFADRFPPDHWVMQSPKVLENEQGILLINDYTPLEDGGVQLHPCVLILFPRDRRSGEPMPADAIVLDAPQGAQLKFEQPFDLSNPKLGRLVEGKLQGPVRIESEMSEPGPDDDLRVETRNVQLSETRIWTLEPVQVAFGQSRASGRELEIRLADGDAKSGVSPTMQSLELTREVHMSLDLKGATLLPADGAAQEPAQPRTAPPVDIRCRGPFRFDMRKYAATFEEQVRVERPNPGQASDTLLCEVLTVEFAARQDGKKNDHASATSQDDSLPRLRATAIVAAGEPVRIDSPSTAARAVCEKLRYELQARRVQMESRRGVSLWQKTNEIHAPQVQYQAAERRGRLGTAQATGPGRLRLPSQSDPGRVFQARWQQRLQLLRQDGQPVISVFGRPHFQMPGMGELTADTAHLWLEENARTEPLGSEPAEPAPPPTPADKRQEKNRLDVQPDRLLATGNVLFDGPQLSGRTERVEVWFEHTVDKRVQQLQNRGLVPRLQQPPENASGTRRVAPDGETTATLPGRGRTPAKRPRNKFNISGKLIRLNVSIQDGRAEVSDVNVAGEVLLKEHSAVEPDQEPLVLRGEHLRLSDAGGDAARAAIGGSPANVIGRGLSMSGETIHVDRGANRVWIDGPGSNSLKSRQDLQGKPAAEQNVTVNWQGRMEFDGSTVRYFRSVVATGAHWRLDAESLEIELTQKIELGRSGSKLDGDGRPEVRRILCRQGAHLENISYENGKQVSLDRMQVEQMELDQQSGDVDAAGPGWLSSVRLSTSGQAAGVLPGSAPLPGSTGPPTSSGHDGRPTLQCLHVDFRRRLQGNLRERALSFVGDVQTAYAPVPSWKSSLNARDVESLGPQGMHLRSDRLNANEIRDPRSGRKSMEFEALGNTVAEGNQYTARAHSIRYAQAKELLVLEGSGRSDARLWRQTRPGATASHAAASRILYWRGTDRVEVEGVRYLDLSRLGKPADGRR